MVVRTHYPSPEARIFQSKVAEKQREVEEARRHLDRLETQLETWIEAARLASRGASVEPSDAQASSPPPAPRATPEDQDARRGMRSDWRAIMRGMVEHHPADLSLDELGEIAERVGFPVNRNTLRSQMSNYAKAGWVDRVREGRFRITQAGAEAARVTLPQNASGGSDAPAKERPPEGSAQPGGLFGGDESDATANVSEGH